jgi:hypothetical protein
VRFSLNIIPKRTQARLSPPSQKPVQPLALTRHAVLRLNGHAAKHSGAGNNYRRRDKRRLDVHGTVSIECQSRLCRITYHRHTFSAETGTFD